MAPKVLDGRYKLIKTLGAGGFGRTFIARDMRRPGNPVCVVKQLMPASDDPGFIREARRLFNTEAETLEKLGKHDQIPQLLAYFEEAQQFFLVQEFIEGKSLYDEFKPIQSEQSPDEPEDTTGSLAKVSTEPIRDRQLSEPEVVGILKDVLGILEFVHAEGVIHRDLKPDNLIRRKKDGRLVLIDFGAVKALQESGTQLEASNGQSRFTVTIGTPGYMPSEQCAGRPAFSSDLYALGMVAIKALTGYSPTDLPTDVETGEIVWRDRAKVSNGLAMVLTRMVRYQYTQRYQSAREALQGLAAFSITEEIKPKTSSSIARTGSSGTSGSSGTRTVAKSQTKSDSGSLVLIVGLLAVAGISFFSLSNLMRSQKTTVVSSPIPTSAPVSSAQPFPTQKATSTPQPNTTSGNNDPNIFKQSLSIEINREVLKDGKLEANKILGYTFSAEEGQRLRTDVSGTNIFMTILDPDKKPVSGATGISSWDGKLPATGDYEMQLKNSSDKGESDYALKVLLTEEATRSIEIKPQ